MKNPHQSPLILLIILILISIRMESQPLSVMTFNIRYDNPADGLDRWEFRKTELAAFIAEKHPQIVGIQEGLLRQVVFLDTALANYTFIGIGRDDGKTEGEFSAIFYDTSKVSLIESGTFWLSATPDTISTGWDAALPRICTYGHFRENVSGEEFYVFNTHFDHQGKIARLESSKLILHKMKQLNQNDLPLILMGDLNDTPESLTITTLVNQLQDCWLSDSSNTEKRPTTFNGFNSAAKDGKRIDYIFSKGFIIRTCSILIETRKNGRVLSDHFPVYCELELE